ncbi:hypothetical protein [Pseudomonas fragi]|uniref:Uncharacterized protein n=1 Tax=Pseudomonas fragi TaxID=296 RepID=A0A449IRW1_PSEFR|nr:hypothetical protein [Pseudomonas fragi]VFB22170.1 Uncharacterised protein [Pseudomonas fragi]
MSTKFTKVNLNDIIVESIVDSLNFNNEQAVLTARDGSAQADETYFERYSNNKSKILKSVGVDELAIPNNVSIEIGIKLFILLLVLALLINVVALYNTIAG